MKIILEADSVIYMYQIFQLGDATRAKFKIINYRLGYGKLDPGVFSYGNPLDYLQEKG